MSLLQIEGDTNGVRDVQIDFIRDVLKERGFIFNQVIFEPVGQAGDNYAANVKRIRVIVEDGEDFKMIAKIAPNNESLRTSMNVAAMFTNEIVMYESILPKLVNLQKTAGVPEENLLQYAQCYGCLKEGPNEVILLQDLRELGYVMLDRFSSLSDGSIRLILKNFAALHSASFVFKKLEPDTYEELKSKLFDIWTFMSLNEDFKSFMTQAETSAVSVVEDKYKESLIGTMTQMPELTVQFAALEKNSDHLIFQHGDSWTNNILFKLHDDVPTQCIMIDYQLTRETKPVCDILYMIFNCTDHDTREKHYIDWIDYYHDQLDESLSEFGMKAKSVYPREQLDADLKVYSKYYFAMAMITYGMILRKPEEAEKIKDAMKDFDMEKMENQMSVSTLGKDTLKLYKSRVEGLIESFKLFGYA